MGTSTMTREPVKQEAPPTWEGGRVALYCVPRGSVSPAHSGIPDFPFRGLDEPSTTIMCSCCPPSSMGIWED